MKGILSVFAAILTISVLGISLSPAFAGQNISINSSLNHDVYGNGDPGDNGSAPGNNYANLTRDPNGNTVSVSNGAIIDNVHGGLASSTSGNASATGNSVSISGGVINHVVDGGSASISSGSGSAASTGNSVSISGGTTGGVIRGGFAVLFVGASGSATSTGNSVSVSGGVMGGDILGGEATTYGSGSAASMGNSVSISGGVIGGDVMGGYAQSASGSATATGNTVTISGAPDLSNAEFYGGWATGGGTNDSFSGNTLNVWNYQGTAVKSLQNFENYAFILPASLPNGGVALEVTNTVTLGNGSGTDSAITQVGFMGGGRVQQAGENFTLIDASGSITGNLANDGQTLAGQKGAALLYDIRVDKVADTLTATILSGPRVNPQMKAVSEGFLSGAVLVNQGADLIAGAGMGNAVSAARNAAQRAEGEAQGYNIGGFGAIEGGKSRYNTGSHVDVRGLSLLAGLSKGFDLDPGRLTLGAFFEYGRGSYDSYNSFSNAASVHGEGDISHYGGGLLGRMDFTGNDNGRFYAEASARLGKAHNEYDSSDLRDAGSVKASYDLSSAYYGLHLGGGYIWNINEKASLDLYGKYFWTRQEGDSVTLSTGDPVRFKAVDSSRLRFGSRFGYALDEHISPYIGAAYEHELDGKAKASTYGRSIDAPSLRGGTGIGELGLTFRAAEGVSLDLGVQGYTGKREGVTGSLQAKWEF